MLKCTNILAFVQLLFDQDNLAEQGARIIRAILEARSPRLTDIAEEMPGQPAANYKSIQRFLARVDPRQALLRLFRAEAPFVLGDPTEIPRPQARKTPYVGTLKDGKTRGFWIMTLATPFRGRAIPFALVSYSSKTIAQMETSRNLYHHQAFAIIRTLLADKPLVLDREFSYLELLLNMVAEKVHFVIRLNLGSHPPTFLDEEGQRVDLSLSRGEERVIPHVFYKGQVPVNLIGRWRRGFTQPLWVMTDLQPQTGFAIYLARMKIDESFRDLKSLLNLEKIMNRKQIHMEKAVALVMLAYAIGLLVGESLRDYLYGPAQPAQKQPASGQPQPATRTNSKRHLYSGLFIFLKRKPRLPPRTLIQIHDRAFRAFSLIIQGPVRTCV
jgi:hypothetical protein